MQLCVTQRLSATKDPKMAQVPTSLTVIGAARIEDWPARLDENLDAFAAKVSAANEKTKCHPDEPVAEYPVYYQLDIPRKQIRLVYAGSVAELVDAPMSHEFPCWEYVNIRQITAAFTRLLKRHPFIVGTVRTGRIDMPTKIVCKEWDALYNPE